VRWRDRRRHRRTLSQGGLAQLDGEAIPPTELLQLALGDGQLEGLVPREVRWLDHRVHRHIWSNAIDKEGLSLAAFIFVLLIIGQADPKLAVEEAHVLEVADPPEVTNVSQCRSIRRKSDHRALLL
jgi:hypothetical protein